MKLINQATLPDKKFTKKQCKEDLIEIHKELFELQNKFFADNQHSLLILFQGIDSSGKDGTIRHVMTGMNPMGVQVRSFTKPTEIEVSHDFLWRLYPHFPSKGMIKVFNRSYYEDLLMPRINKTMKDEEFIHRCKFINSLEEHLTLNNTTILKFFLNISQKEQEKRIEFRKESTNKFWKYSKEDDTAVRQFEQYRAGYDEVFTHCKTEKWNVIPADKRWYRNYAVAKILVDHLKSLKLKYPQGKTA